MAMNEHDADERHIGSLYRQAAIEEPSSRLDAWVRNAARRSLDEARVQPERRAWWQMWRIPLAVACVAVLSVSVVTLIEREGGEPLTLEPAPSAPSAVQPALPDASSPAAGHADKSAELRGQSSEQSKAHELKPERRGRHAQPQLTPAVPAYSPPVSAGPAVPASVEPAERNAMQRDERQVPLQQSASSESAASIAGRGRAALPAPSAPPTELQRAPAFEPAPTPAAPRTFAASPEAPSRPLAKATRADSASAAAPVASARRFGEPEAQGAMTATVASLVAELDGRTPERWLERVLALRREGRREDADALLAEFKRRYPDQPLPPSLR